MRNIRRQIVKSGAGFQAPARPAGNVTPQQKIGYVANQLGIPGIVQGQGTTRSIYHFLQLTEGANSSQLFSFFQSVANTSKPFTNITSNKLGTGEAMVIQRMYFVIMATTTATGEIVDIDTLEGFGLPGFFASTFNIKIAQSDVTKDPVLFTSRPEFNPYAMHQNYNVYHFDTQTVIPPDLEFVVNVNSPAFVVPSSATLSYYIGCVIEGTGSLPNLRQPL